MKQTTFLLAAFAAISITSCKKDKKTTTTDPGPVVNCDLVSEIYSATDTSVYEYDSENRLVREMDNGELYLSVQYLDNGNTVKETYSTSINTYQLNAHGFPTTALFESNNGQRTRNFYSYDANGFVTKAVSKSLNAEDSVLAQDSIVYTNTIANGNLVHQVLVGLLDVEIAITHDLNRPNNAPVAKPWTAPFYGGGRNDNNLMLTATLTNPNTSASETTDFSYLYDSKGRITRRVATTYGNTVTHDTTYYKYRCD